MTDNQELRRYSVGDTITIGFKLSDESGVGNVVAYFLPEGEEGEGILLRGDGGGAKEIVVRCQGRVEENHSPGPYHLKYLQTSDVSGNTSMPRPDPGPRFYVEEHAGDSEGPQHQGWQFFD